MYLLDTNVVSELRKVKAGKANPNVTAWARAAVPATLFLSTIVTLELEFGVLLAERRDPEQGALLRNWLDGQVIPAFAGRLLSIDLAISRRAAALSFPNPRPFRDGLIAATALVHRMTVITRNVSDFVTAGLDVINPWESLSPD